MEDIYDAEELYPARRATIVDIVRFTVGLAARGVFWLCFLFIVGNALGEAVRQGEWLLAVLGFGVSPGVFFIYPFAAGPEAMAWPFAEGTSFVPALLVALVAYPVSTFVGGLPPVDR